MRIRVLLLSLVAAIIAVSGLLRAAQGTSARRSSINGPSSLATDNRGHLFVREQEENKLLRIDLRAGTIATIAGNGKKCCYKDGVGAADVSLKFLESFAINSLGDVFLGDEYCVRKVDARTGLISTVAGDGMYGDTIDGASALKTHFWSIDGLAVNSSGDLFVADGRQSKIFRIDNGSGIVRIYAGDGTKRFSGDKGPASLASFQWAEDITFDKEDNLILSDSGNCRIRRIDHATAIVDTIAITGGAAQNCPNPDNIHPNSAPHDLALDSAGNIYFSEPSVLLLLRIDAKTSEVSVLLGPPTTRTKLHDIAGLAIDSDGSLFVSGFSDNRVRRVDATTKAITTIAGNGLPHRIDILL
jgi:hypothetical protein